MQKPVKVLWGIATFMPLLMILLGAVLLIVFFVSIVGSMPKGNQPPPPEFFVTFIGFYVLILGGIFLNWALNISYFIHLVRTDRLDKNGKTLWAVLFMVFQTLAKIPYWFLYVLPDGPEETEKKPRRRSGA